ncbi:hypothetical protein D0Z03_001796 [Geotrichum reessii]|nr:hypothetical protein D0Z03_001796 [Galactomyces reessii]
MTTPIEPATTAAVTLHTSRGELTLELWAKEVPRTCRLFLARCISGDLAGSGSSSVNVARLLKGELVQFSNNSSKKSDPAFAQKELHSRLSFTARTRGYIGAGWAAGDLENGNNDKDGGFFVTLGISPRVRALNGRHTVFGKVVGDSVYTLSKIEDGSIEDDGKPVTPILITEAVVTKPYFEDIQQLLDEKNAEKEAAKAKAASATIQSMVSKKKTITKKVKVRLSYDEDNEDAGIPLWNLGQKSPKKKFKMKAAHEVMNDKSLVIEPVMQPTSSSSEAITLSNLAGQSNNIKRDTETAAVSTTKDIKVQVSLPLTSTKALPKTTQDFEDEFEALKATLKSDKNRNIDRNQNAEVKQSLVEKEKSQYLRKRNVLKKGSERREAETLALLTKFTAKMGSFSKSPVSETSKSVNQTTSTVLDTSQNSFKQSKENYNSESEYEEDENFDEGDLYSHTFLPQHETSKDDSLITQFTGTKHNDDKFSEADPENLLEKTQKKSTSLGSRTGALSSTQKLREELRRKKLEKLGD